MAQLNVQPDRMQVVINYSTTQTFGTSKQYKFVPLNPDGTIKDCTGFSSGQLNYPNPTVALPDQVTNDPIATISADATGIVMALSVSQCNTIAGKLASAQVQASIAVTDGTDTMIVCKGTLQLITQP